MLISLAGGLELARTMFKFATDVRTGGDDAGPHFSRRPEDLKTKGDGQNHDLTKGDKPSYRLFGFSGQLKAISSDHKASNSQVLGSLNDWYDH